MIYADDTQLYYTFPLSQFDEAISKINIDLRSLWDFFLKHNLFVNPFKSSIMLLGFQHFRNGIDINEVKLYLGNLFLPVTENIKFTSQIFYNIRRTSRVTRTLRTAKWLNMCQHRLYHES